MRTHAASVVAPSPPAKPLTPALWLCASLLASGCSSQPAGTAADAAAIVDAAADASVPRGVGSVRGVVRDSADNAVGDARIKAGAVEVVANYKGEFEIKFAPAGPLTLAVTADWYEPLQHALEVEPDRINAVELLLEPRALRIDPTDRTLALTHAASFDWTQDELSLVLIEGVTRSNIDRALFRHNPAMYRDTSKESQVTPSPLPSIVSGTASGFSFDVGGASALASTTICDELTATPITAAERLAFMVWRPMLRYVSLEIGAAAATELAAVGAAVEDQRWGGQGEPTQQIERVFLHGPAGGRQIWIEIVFADFVDLGAGVSDSDGDGRREVFARVDAAHTDALLLDRLAKEYLQPELDTLAAKRALDDVVDHLYGDTNPSIISALGQPYQAPGVGTVAYPFAVLEHSSNNAINVLLLGP